MSTIGSRIKQIRLKINLSQEDFANFFGTGKSYVSAVEHDKCKLSQENLIKLLVNYNVNMNYVLGGIGEMFIAPKYEEVGSEIESKVLAILKKQGIIE